MIKFCDWYKTNKEIIQFHDVVIRCMRENSEHECDALFKCKLSWDDAIKLFGEYYLISIRQGTIVDGHRQEHYHTIQCSIYPEMSEVSTEDV